MKKSEYKKNDQAVFSLLVEVLKQSQQYRTPSYEEVVERLNEQGITTNWGNEWTRHRLFRYLQRKGFSGLWGLHCHLKSYQKLAQFL